MANANTNTIALFNLQTKQENDYSFLLDNILLCQNKIIHAKIVSVIINTVHSIQRVLVLFNIIFAHLVENMQKM